MKSMLMSVDKESNSYVVTRGNGSSEIPKKFFNIDLRLTYILYQLKRLYQIVV